MDSWGCGEAQGHLNHQNWWLDCDFEGSWPVRNFVRKIHFDDKKWKFFFRSNNVLKISWGHFEAPKTLLDVLKMQKGCVHLNYLFKHGTFWIFFSTKNFKKWIFRDRKFFHFIFLQETFQNYSEHFRMPSIIFLTANW